jgi:hypothetical protein
MLSLTSLYVATLAHHLLKLPVAAEVENPNERAARTMKSADVNIFSKTTYDSYVSQVSSHLSTTSTGPKIAKRKLITAETARAAMYPLGSDV